MLRKVLTLGMAFILALSLLAVSMITCFTYDAEAGPLENGHTHWDCTNNCTGEEKKGLHSPESYPLWYCHGYTQ